MSLLTELCQIIRLRRERARKRRNRRRDAEWGGALRLKGLRDAGLLTVHGSLDEEGRGGTTLR
jgi:hypothetical protein